jgi:hypothetical protein
MRAISAELDATMMISIAAYVASMNPYHIGFDVEAMTASVAKLLSPRSQPTDEHLHTVETVAFLEHRIFPLRDN